jgi:UDP-N-acetylmuramate dehydrogenase
MTFRQNISLQPFNSFGIDQQTGWFCEIADEAEFPAILNFLREHEMPVLIVGGGSNMLLTKDFEGLVIRNRLMGIEVVSDEADHVLVKAAAGEVWHDFVMYCIDKGYGGIENLSLIPGCVGAAPMQNIGAYGVEIKDTFSELEALHMKTGKKRSFSLEECYFGYRESVFKNEVKGEYLITSVTFRLSKNPQFQTTYGAIQQELEKMGVKELSIRAISQAVINIRSSKLPDPKKIGNAGSFFKNPVVENTVAGQLKAKHPDLPVYPSATGTKLAAGWLIEKAGWKGFTVDDRYGVHKLQALVLVNYHDTKGHEIYQLSSDIIRSVEEQFGVTLEREVNII